MQFLDSDDLLGIDAIAAKANFLRQNPDVSVAVSPNRLFSSECQWKTKNKWVLAFTPAQL